MTPLPRRYLFTSESVTEGHPDKICDQISDTIVDELLTRDPYSRVAAEVVVKNNDLFILGELQTQAPVTAADYEQWAKRKIAEIGYTNPEYGFSSDQCRVHVLMDVQSPEIAQGVDRALEQRADGSVDPLDQTGAGDQGLMFGFACDETPELMPLPIALAHRLARRLAQVRKLGELPYLRPDGKTQVTVIYEDFQPVGIDTILISTQHDPTIGDLTSNEAVQGRIKRDLWEAVVLPVFADTAVRPDAQTKFLVNPTGRFVTGGPCGDSGLTGRKIIVDTYGGYARHGGGAFSGKDPTKVDRSAAYGCRFAAKNIVAAGLARRCEVQVSYAIGKARPVSVLVETFGTGRVPESVLLELIQKYIELRPAGLIQAFHLRDLPRERGGRFYQDVATYGHFGRMDLDLPWEHTELSQQLREAALSVSL
ncbi:MAG: methionine adenosyltransferase [Gloeomargarita sp. GMQP_bins_120]